MGKQVNKALKQKLEAQQKAKATAALKAKKSKEKMYEAQHRMGLEAGGHKFPPKSSHQEQDA
jgi:hypothetical protein